MGLYVCIKGLLVGLYVCIKGLLRGSVCMH